MQPCEEKPKPERLEKNTNTSQKNGNDIQLGTK